MFVILFLRDVFNYVMQVSEMQSQKFVEMCYCSCAAAQNRVLERQAAVKCVRFRNYKQDSSAVRF